MKSPRSFAETLLIALLAVLPLAASQDRPGAGVDREAMWWAPTAADWQKPCLLTFQRTWEDAVVLSRETQKPILVCINMDGEIASEHYAGVRYRSPEIAALYEPYVCVIASVYRHSPRDHDEEGKRILCPRFGSVTCGEHIAIEPLLYEKFMEGRRIAPRHIMVELDGAETYDVFYAWDTDSVFQAIREGIEKRAITAPPIVRGDRSIVEKVASRDVADRIAVERAYAEGNRETREALLRAAEQNPAAEQVDLLRLGIFGLDPELARLARRALAKSSTENALDLITEALRAPGEESEREALVAALTRIGESSPRARTLAVVHRGLASRSREVDVEGWSKALGGGGSYAAAAERSSIESRIDERAAAIDAAPEDPEVQLELAEATLALAVDPASAANPPATRRAPADATKLLFEDARRAALEAERLGAKGWRVDAALALSSYWLGDLETAYARAEAAAPSIPVGAVEWSAIATIALFAEARQKAIRTAVLERKEWPPRWLTDVDAAYSVLARHPLGSENHVLTHYDFLQWLGATGRAVRVLDEGLQRFPESWMLHDRLRGRALRERGVPGLAAVYEEMLASKGSNPALEWFAGYASLVAAEFRRREGANAEALAAYERAITHYERFTAARPEGRASADHYVAVALGGRARIAYEQGDDVRAVAELLASFQRSPDSASTLDGLNLSAVDTAKMVRVRLQGGSQAELLAKLQAGLDALDPRHLELPAYEREVPPAGSERRPPRRQRP